MLCHGYLKSPATQLGQTCRVYQPDSPYSCRWKEAPASVLLLSAIPWSRHPISSNLSYSYYQARPPILSLFTITLLTLLTLLSELPASPSSSSSLSSLTTLVAWSLVWRELKGLGLSFSHSLPAPACWMGPLHPPQFPQLPHLAFSSWR